MMARACGPVGDGRRVVARTGNGRGTKPGGHGGAVEGFDDQAFASEQNIDLYERGVGFRIEFFQRCGGYSLRFVDGQARGVADFPWGDNVERDLRSWTLSDIPLGNAARPYSDLDQFWWIVFWRNTDQVYIAQSENHENLHRTFWVPAEDYLAAWESRSVGHATRLRESRFSFRPGQ
jgi:hypothetical protein